MPPESLPPESPVRALTICQPWAWAIMDGRKPLENRSWPTRYRGRLWIHAGKSQAWLTPQLPDGSRAPGSASLVFGALLGTVKVIDCVRSIAPRVTQDPRLLPWISDQGWCWLLADPQPLETPIPCRGAQGLWTPPAEVVSPRRAQRPQREHGAESMLFV